MTAAGPRVPVGRRRPSSVSVGRIRAEATCSGTRGPAASGPRVPMGRRRPRRAASGPRRSSSAGATGGRARGPRPAGFGSMHTARDEGRGSARSRRAVGSIADGRDPRAGSRPAPYRFRRRASRPVVLGRRALGRRVLGRRARCGADRGAVRISWRDRQRHPARAPRSRAASSGERRRAGRGPAPPCSRLRGSRTMRATHGNSREFVGAGLVPARAGTGLDARPSVGVAGLAGPVTPRRRGGTGPCRCRRSRAGASRRPRRWRRSGSPPAGTGSGGARRP